MRHLTKTFAAAAVVVALGALVITSCSSPRYERTWQTTRLAKDMSPLGCWEGTWRSETNGHQGKLRCLVTRMDQGYQFHYQARWGYFFTGEFKIVCPVEPSSPGVWKVRGSKDLGTSFGGTFSHEATISQTTLEARYSAALDHGVMQLQRVR
jgi:hypothetical protein